MEEKQQHQGNRRRFTEEFKRDAVNLVRATGRPIAQIAQELGIYDSTLGNWVRQDRIDRGEAKGLTSDERVRLRQLEAENAKLRGVAPRTCWAGCSTPTSTTWPGAATSPTSRPAKAGCTWPASSTWPQGTWWATR
jgi:transposase